jgi:hypothetical protein
MKVRIKTLEAMLQIPDVRINCSGEIENKTYTMFSREERSLLGEIIEIIEVRQSQITPSLKKYQYGIYAHEWMLEQSIEEFIE